VVPVATDEFVRASRLRADGGPYVRREDYWETLADEAGEADECRVCGASGPDCRRGLLPDASGKVTLCAACRSLWVKSL
jgi:hypothetical protein